MIQNPHGKQNMEILFLLVPTCSSDGGCSNEQSFDIRASKNFEKGLETILRKAHFGPEKAC